MNKQSENGFQSSDGVQPDYEFQEKPWYTAYDFEALRDKMTPEEMEIYKEGKDMQKMRSLTITLLKQLQHRSEQNIKVRCPKCGKNACCIKVENGLFLCWSCDQGAQFKGQLHELAKLKHSEGSSIDAGYYLRANADAKHKAEPDYTPMVDDDYEEIDEKTRSMIFPLEDEEEASSSSSSSPSKENKPPVSQYVISARYMVKQYLKDMGISVETAMKAGVCCGYMSHKVDDAQNHDPQGYEQVAAIAYCNRVCGRIVNVKMRSVAKDPHGGYIKDFWQKSPTQPCAPYGIDCINPLRINAEPIDRLIITEGEKDRLTLMQCGFPYVISVASGCKTDIRKSHEAFAEWIAQAEEIVVCGDSDRPGRGLVKRLLKFYADQATLAELPGRCKDISEVYARYGAETVRKIILGAKELGMEDVYAAEQHADDIKRVMLGQYDHGYSIGMGPLTDRVFHLTSSGGLVVVTGIPNSGKTDFLNCMMAHLIFHCHKRVGFFSFELPDKAKHFTNVAQVGVGVTSLQKWVQNVRTRELDPELERTRLDPLISYLGDHMVDFTAQSELPTPSYIVRMGERLRRKHGLDFLVIDPYMFVAIDEGKERLTETQQVKEFLTKVQAWSRKHGVWTFVVAHPRIQHKDGTQGDLDFYEIAGSANWVNLADFLFSVRRVIDPNPNSPLAVNYTVMKMMKVRDQQLSSLGEVYYTRRECGRYEERASQQECEAECRKEVFPEHDMGSWLKTAL